MQEQGKGIAEEGCKSVLQGKEARRNQAGNSNAWDGKGITQQCLIGQVSGVRGKGPMTEKQIDKWFSQNTRAIIMGSVNSAATPMTFQAV